MPFTAMGANFRNPFQTKRTTRKKKRKKPPVAEVKTAPADIFSKLTPEQVFEAARVLMQESTDTHFMRELIAYCGT